MKYVGERNSRPPLRRRKEKPRCCNLLSSSLQDCPFIVCMTYAFHTPDKLCFILDLMNGEATCAPPAQINLESQSVTVRNTDWIRQLVADWSGHA